MKSDARSPGTELQSRRFSITQSALHESSNNTENVLISMQTNANLQNQISSNCALQNVTFILTEGVREAANLNLIIMCKFPSRNSAAYFLQEFVYRRN